MHKKHRNSKRFRTPSSIDIMLLDGTPLSGLGKVHDVSEGGICFSCSGYIKENQMVVVAIKDSKGMIRLTARVVRVLRAFFHKGQSEVGISFLNVTEDDKSRLRRLPKKMWWLS